MSTVVVKVGGHASGDGAAIAVVEELAASHGVVVVHGAGPQITREMERRGLEVRFVGGGASRRLKPSRSCERRTGTSTRGSVRRSGLGR